MTGVLRHIVAAILAAVCAVAATAGRSTLARVCAMVDDGGGDPIEGVWRIAGDGAVFAVLPGEGGDTFRLVIVDSPDMSVLPMTEFGTARRTAVAGRYDARLSASLTSGAAVRRDRNLIISLRDDGTLIFEPYKKGLKLNLWRVLPYMFRFSVASQNTRPSDIDGAVRLYPAGDAVKPLVF